MTSGNQHARGDMCQGPVANYSRKKKHYSAASTYGSGTAQKRAARGRRDRRTIGESPSRPVTKHMSVFHYRLIGWRCTSLCPYRTSHKSRIPSYTASGISGISGSSRRSRLIVLPWDNWGGSALADWPLRWLKLSRRLSAPLLYDISEVTPARAKVPLK